MKNTCPNCHEVFNVSNDKVESKVNCPNCSTQLAIGDLNTQETAKTPITVSQIESDVEKTLLVVIGHPRLISPLWELISFLPSDEYWSILISTRRVLLVLEKKSRAKIITTALTGAIGGHLLSPLVEEISKPQKATIGKSKQILTETKIKHIKDKAIKYIEFTVAEGPEQAIQEEDKSKISFVFKKGVVTFGEKKFLSG